MSKNTNTAEMTVDAAVVADAAVETLNEETKMNANTNAAETIAVNDVVTVQDEGDVKITEINGRLLVGEVVEESHKKGEPRTIHFTSDDIVVESDDTVDTENTATEETKMNANTNTAETTDVADAAVTETTETVDAAVVAKGMHTDNERRAISLTSQASGFAGQADKSQTIYCLNQAWKVPHGLPQGSEERNRIEAMLKEQDPQILRKLAHAGGEKTQGWVNGLLEILRNSAKEKGFFSKRDLYRAMIMADEIKMEIKSAVDEIHELMRAKKAEQNPGVDAVMTAYRTASQAAANGYLDGADELLKEADEMAADLGKEFVNTRAAVVAKIEICRRGNKAWNLLQQVHALAVGADTEDKRAKVEMLLQTANEAAEGLFFQTQIPNDVRQMVAISYRTASYKASSADMDKADALFALAEGAAKHWNLDFEKMSYAVSKKIEICRRGNEAYTLLEKARQARETGEMVDGECADELYQMAKKAADGLYLHGVIVREMNDNVEEDAYVAPAPARKAPTKGGLDQGGIDLPIPTADSDEDVVDAADADQTVEETVNS